MTPSEIEQQIDEAGERGSSARLRAIAYYYPNTPRGIAAAKALDKRHVVKHYIEQGMEREQAISAANFHMSFLPTNKQD